MTQTPETHTPVNYQPEAWPVEPFECQLSIGHATGSLATDVYNMSVVQQPIQKSGSQHIATQKITPVAEVFVAG